MRRNGTPSPRGADGKWGRTTIRNIILSDTYLGTFWWGKEKRTTTTVSVVENGVRIYRKKVKKEKRPREEWTAISVPDSGIPPETIYPCAGGDRGEHLERFLQPGQDLGLSRGVGFCGQCGSRLKPYSTSNSLKTKYFYYLCSNRISARENGTCPNTKHYPAETLELFVRDTLVDAFQPKTWVAFVDDVCDRKLENLHRLARSNPGKTRESLAGRIKALEMKLDRARDLFIDGDLLRTDYEKKKASIQGDIEAIQGELTKMDDLDTEIKRVEDLRIVLKGIENPLSGHYALTEFSDSYLINLMDEDLGYGSKETAARRRQAFYRESGLRVTVGDKTEISLSIDGITVGSDNSASGSTGSPTGTP